MKTLEARGFRIAYDDYGDAADTLVLLHGYPFNRSMWREQASALSARHRVIAPDLRGHGETTISESVTMEEMARDVAALIDELKIERATIGGLSMGGYVTLAFYRLFPERARALVLADTRANADTAEARRTRAESAQQALREGMSAIADAMLPKLLAPATLRDRPDIAERVRRMMIDTEPSGAAAALHAMAARRDQTNLLPEIDVPTLVIAGSEDALTPPRDSEAIRDAIPHSRMEIIEGAAHVSNIERPDEFTRVLKRFLDNLA